jgi:alpha-beta hydrolase superfamily lysophospholipase
MGGKEVGMPEIFDNGSLRTEDGLNLYFCRDIPLRPRALVLLLHSLGEHSGSYEAMTTRLKAAGYGVIRFDFRGHGRSDGPRGDVQDFQDYLRDTDAVVERAHRDFPGLPLFLVGHSMGALVAACYAVEHPKKIDGEITSCAALRLMPALEFLRGCSRYRHGERGDERFSFIIPARQDEASGVWGEDWQMQDSVTVRLAGAVWIQVADWFAPRMKELNIPLLILHGGEDSLVPPEVSQWFYDGVSSPDRSLHVYPEQGHSLLGKDGMVFDDIVQWLDQHRRREPPAGLSS